jgi:inosine-uridine nucleoside N-ribohydrolase
MSFDAAATMGCGPIIMDTDLNFPSDDFQALLLLACSSSSRLVACSAVAGNTWMEEVWFNLRGSLHLLGRRDTPIAWGHPYTTICDQRPWALRAREMGVCRFVGAFEKSSKPRLDDCDFSAMPRKRSLAELVRHYSEQRGPDLEVLATGPLTNVASALAMAPEFERRCRRLTIMAGNFSAAADKEPADFNVWFDPLSAKTVFNSRIPLRIVSADLCRSVRSGSALSEALGRHVGGWADVFNTDFKGMARQHGEDMPLLDQLAALVCIDESLVANIVRGRVEVDCRSGETRGRTRFIRDQAGNAELITDVDRDRVYRAIEDHVARMSESTVYCDDPFWKQRIL